MAVSYTDDEIDALVREHKRLSQDWEHRTRLKAKRGHHEQFLELNGDAGTKFQGLLRIGDVSYLSQERVKSTFMDDFRTLLSETLPKERMSFDWNDPTHDPHGIYAVDCRVNGMPRRLFVHALGNEGRTRDATSALLQFEKWVLRSAPLPSSKIRNQSAVECWRASAMCARGSSPA